MSDTIGETLEAIGAPQDSVTVRLSRELITLLSDQLYSSPLKAIEELVVNSFDADATSCWVTVPSVSTDAAVSAIPAICVLDDGVGMNQAGLSDLWRVGASNKRKDATQSARKRVQIGKFGIGKLATYALANRITYVSSTGAGELLSVSLLYSDFQSSPAGSTEEPVTLQVRSIMLDELVTLPVMADLIASMGSAAADILTLDKPWTLVVLEDLRERAAKISAKRLNWVLSTAMPITDFKLFLNGNPVESSKATYKKVAEFEISDLPEERLERLRRKTGEDWSVRYVTSTDGESVGALVCETLPSGVSGHAYVAEKTIYGGKSADLTRSHGFFIKVRGRLIAEDDPLFGNTPLSYEVFNRLRVDVNADDLDIDLTAPRESAGNSDRVVILQAVLVEIFNEARTRYEDAEAAKFKQETKQENERNYVHPRFVERPIADALLSSDKSSSTGESKGSEADDSWFYIKSPPFDNIGNVASGLYSTTNRDPYVYRLEEMGREGRLVSLDPQARQYTINADHDLSLAFKDNPVARDLLYNLATAEALLEVYLRETNLTVPQVGDVLERRDRLLRSLAREQVNSPASIGANLRDSVNSERDLEIALVIAARALGFVAKHIGNGGRADGVARFNDYPDGIRRITLEAKSSGTVPSLSALDFAGLEEHLSDEKADGCLLIAPSYPGGSKGDNASAAKRAVANKISCWTIDQLARVVESLDTKDITARAVLDIVLGAFTPEDVEARVNRLLEDPSNASREIASAMVKALRELETIVGPDTVRSLDMLLVEIGRSGLRPSKETARTALSQLAGASGGSITLINRDAIILNTSIEELERRVSNWVKNDSSTRRGSTFHSDTGEHRGRRPDVG